MSRAPRHVRQVYGAINRCRVSDKKSNSVVWAEGPKRTLLTMEGPRSYDTPIRSFTLLTMTGPEYYFQGVLTFRYYDTTVLVVDLFNNRLTDHGYHEYSMSTRSNVKSWLDAVEDRFRLKSKIPWNWFDWTDSWRAPRETGRHMRRPMREPDMLRERFRSNVPWVTRDSTARDGSFWWFNWDKYDPALADQFWQSKDFLREDQNHRYFDFDWSNEPSPRWIRLFKDDDAMRRWRQREKRNGRPCPPI